MDATAKKYSEIKNKGKEIAVYAQRPYGHRDSYINLLSRFFRVRLVSKLSAFWVRDPLLFLMIEENFPLFLTASMVRSIFGKRTVGILFRPQPTLDGATFKLKFKRVSLATLRGGFGVGVISLLPWYLNQSFRDVSDAFIHDPQLWDVPTSQTTAALRPQGNIIERAAGRPIILFLGARTEEKGYQELWQCFGRGGGDPRVFLIVAGPPGMSEYQWADSSNVENIDRWLEEDEVLRLYQACDFVWCAYSPIYDQASGVLGRAIQLGKTPIVRAGSYAEKFCAHWNRSSIVVEWPPSQALFQKVHRAPTDQSKVDWATISKQLEDQSIESLAFSLLGDGT